MSEPTTIAVADATAHQALRASPPVAVITGASRGLGAGIAGQLASAGWRLGLCARTTPGTATHAPGSITASVDVRDPEALEALADQVTDELGPIELWINNAGVLAPIGPLRNAPVGELRDHVAINLQGTMWGSRVFARLVHDRPAGGTLINISSGAAHSVYQGWSAYCATKAGVDHLTRVIAAEEATAGLAAFAVSPGVVDTDMQAAIRATPPERFPQVGRFIGLAETESFNSPAWVATKILELHDGTRTGSTPDWVTRSDDPVVVRVPPEPR